MVEWRPMRAAVRPVPEPVATPFVWAAAFAGALLTVGVLSAANGLADPLHAGDGDDADDRNDDVARHSRRRKAAVAFLIIALAGMILTAVLTSPPADDTPRPPKSLAPAACIHTRRRDPRREGHCQ